jgi:microcystin-dependent protein
LGQRAGAENTTLTIAQIPTHSHPTSVQVNNQDGEEANIAGQFLSNHPGATNENPIAGQTLGGVTAGNAGGNGSHTNIQPFTVVNFVLCVSGIFPSRN